jgi:hypothetical protein
MIRKALDVANFGAQPKQRMRERIASLTGTVGHRIQTSQFNVILVTCTFASEAGVLLT